ncbi:glutaredoxin family protein [Streptomyces sp. NPDC060011]|uniref:glutaredoxin family protein n=1 Tax=unclassified Streptomyces TaxID=2593676 RepID=UPI0013BA5F5A|nr:MULTISPECIES: glutaredoxin family protein [unclassified Streptomyces]MCX4916194.1 glutaredoxin family protein [Streptomyces sp. NBC_00687]MCX5131705.1 glutaredoxin family protein [Streptomyces sp. NBC_00340]MCX5284810.1 glutaredoxin family protein [Streptomyces sp. NBC_00198]NEB28132.1 glutaredoxin family protein [Streptomyces sp. SID14446]WSD78344.1 glutaredoxin family protein [Streptomyces sp. NBC_01558]
MARMSPMFRRSDRRTERKAPEDRLVTLIRKPGCHLCDDAQEVIEKVCADLGVPWERKDITEDEELHRQYWEQIPVVLVDGAQHTFWRVNEERLRKALAP